MRWRLPALLLPLLALLGGCTFSDSLRQDEIRSVWQPAAAAKATNVFFATDREPDRNSFNLHWGATLRCGSASLDVPPALAPQGAELPALRPIACDDPASLAEFAQRIANSAKTDKCDRLLIIVHGYNMTFRSVLLHGAQVAADTQWSCETLLFSWSSEGKFDRYAADIERSGYAVPLLISLFRELNAAGLKTEILAQSMGARITLGALTALCTGKKPVTDQLILAAPDVGAERDNDDFGRFLRQTAPCARRITIYASDNDIALITSESAHGGIPRAGRVPGKDLQYVSSGGNIDVVDASLAPAGSVGHDYFVLSYEMMGDVMWTLAGASIAERADPVDPARQTLVRDRQPGADWDRYALKVAWDRRPTLASQLLRQVWPLFLPVQ